MGYQRFHGGKERDVRRPPKYLAEVIAEGRTHGKPGEVTVVDVYHDDDCAIWQGGPCDCQPVVKARKPKANHRRRPTETH